jgi:hypothetical protein
VWETPSSKLVTGSACKLAAYLTYLRVGSYRTLRKLDRGSLHDARRMMSILF